MFEWQIASAAYRLHGLKGSSLSPCNLKIKV